MPCDTIQTMTVQLNLADMDLLFAALLELSKRQTGFTFGTPQRDGTRIDFGWNQSFNKATGEIRVRDAKQVALIKQAYSAQIVKAQAKRYGWQLKETAPFQYNITKR
jgi:hypothetical protein